MDRAFCALCLSLPSWSCVILSFPFNNTISFHLLLVFSNVHTLFQITKLTGYSRSEKKREICGLFYLLEVKCDNVFEGNAVFAFFWLCFKIWKRNCKPNNHHGKLSYSLLYAQNRPVYCESYSRCCSVFSVIRVMNDKHPP